MREDYLLVHSYLEEALKVSEEISYLPGKYKALNHIGITMYNIGKFHEAHQYLEKSLELSLSGGVGVEIWANLIGVAGLSGKIWLKSRQQGLLEQATLLCGAISALMNSRGEVLDQPFRKYYEQALEVTRSGLDEVAFKEAFVRGQAMSLEEANIYAGQALAEIQP
jgi:tetratricopeptide (TPR) repeat protein